MGNITIRVFFKTIIFKLTIVYTNKSVPLPALFFSTDEVLSEIFSFPPPPRHVSSSVSKPKVATLMFIIGFGLK